MEEKCEYRRSDVSTTQSGFKSFLNVVQFVFYLVGLPIGLIFSVQTNEVKKIKRLGAIILGVVLISQLGVAVQLVGAAVFLAIVL